MSRIVTVAIVALSLGLCRADVVDIIGYVYYQDFNETYYYEYGDSIAPGCVALPVNDADVSLYKRNSSSGWDLYGSTVLTDDGYYVFDDIDVGRDSGDLCTNSHWFKVLVDATEEGCLPEDWAYPMRLTRFSHNALRPSGIPDAGAIRVDFVFESSCWYVYTGSSLDVDELTGHWVTEDATETFSLEQGNGEATCPFNDNTVDVGSCLHGHLHNTFCFDDWEEEDDYSEYIFWPLNGDEGDALGWFYTYWTEPWPVFAKHYDINNNVFIVVDIVYLQP